MQREAPPSAPGPEVEPEVVLSLPDAARAAQVGFERTGSLHATAIFEPDGRLLIVREDVGRHNAMDKAVGALLVSGRYPLAATIACLSGRAAFELVQKASVAGMAGVVSVGAPTTLAVRLARERGLLLCGFVRDGSFNVYAGAERLRRLTKIGFGGRPFGRKEISGPSPTPRTGGIGCHVRKRSSAGERTHTAPTATCRSRPRWGRTGRPSRGAVPTAAC